MFRVPGIHAEGVGFLLVRVLHFFGVVGLEGDLLFWFGAEGWKERKDCPNGSLPPESEGIRPRNGKEVAGDCYGGS